MKVIKLDESNFEKNNLDKHYKRHFTEYSHDPRFAKVKDNEEEFKKLYDKIADELSWVRVSKSDSDDNYVGYIAKDGRRKKYNKATRDFVSYSKDKTITMHKKDLKSYNKTLEREFLKEFPYNE